MASVTFFRSLRLSMVNAQNLLTAKSLKKTNKINIFAQAYETNFRFLFKI